MSNSLIKYGLLSCMYIAQNIHAQTAGLLVNSPYSGVYATQLNPATSSNMKYKWVVSLGSIDTKISNDYMSINMPYHPIRILFGNYPDSLKTTYNNPLWRWTWLQTNARRETVSLHSLVRINGPSALYKYKNHSFGLLTEVNFFADMNGMPRKLADQIYRGLKHGKKLQDKPENLEDIQNLHLSIKQQAWVALGFNYSYQWVFKRRKKLSAGITYKLLHARGGSQIQIDAGGFTEQDDKSISISSPGIEIKTMMPRNNIFYPRGYGGIDLGLLFQNKKSETGRHNNSKNLHPDYLYELGLSVLDIGNLVYTRTITTELQSRNQSITLPSVDEIMSWTPEKAKEELMKAVSEIDNLVPETFYGKKIRIGLPTRLVLHGNIQLRKHLFIDGILQQNLRRRDGNNINTYSYLSLSPRFENKRFTFGLPLSLDNNYRKPNIGFYMRVVWLYFGSRNIASIISPNGKQDADFFMGIQFGNIPGKAFKGKSPYMFFRKRNCAEF